MKALFEYYTLNTLAEIKLPIKNTIIPFVSVGPRIEYLNSYS
jgi:hypothetical protein